MNPIHFLAAVLFFGSSQTSALDRKIERCVDSLHLPSPLRSQIRYDRVSELYEGADDLDLRQQGRTVHIWYLENLDTLRSKLRRALRETAGARIHETFSHDVYILDSPDLIIGIRPLGGRSVNVGVNRSFLSGLRHNDFSSVVARRRETYGFTKQTHIEIQWKDHSGISTTKRMSDDALFKRLVKLGIPTGLQHALTAPRIVRVGALAYKESDLTGSGLVIDYWGDPTDVWRSLSKFAVATRLDRSGPRSSASAHLSTQALAAQGRLTYWVTVRENVGMVDPLDLDSVVLPPTGCENRIDSIEARFWPGELFQVHVINVAAGRVPEKLPMQNKPWLKLKD